MSSAGHWFGAAARRADWWDIINESLQAGRGSTIRVLLRALPSCGCNETYLKQHASRPLDRRSRRRIDLRQATWASDCMNQGRTCHARAARARVMLRYRSWAWLKTTGQVIKAPKCYLQLNKRIFLNHLLWRWTRRTGWHLHNCFRMYHK